MLFYQRVWTMTSKNCIWTEDYCHWMKSFDHFFLELKSSNGFISIAPRAMAMARDFMEVPLNHPRFIHVCVFFQPINHLSIFIGHFPWCSIFFRIFHEINRPAGSSIPWCFPDTGPRSTPDNIFGDTLKPGSPTPELADGFVVFLTPWTVSSNCGLL